MEQIAGEDGAGSGAGVRENDPDKNQQADLWPTVAQLRGMQQAEYRARKKNADRHAEAPRRDGIDVSAKNRFFEQRGERDAHSEEQDCGTAILQELFDGQLGFGGEE